MKNENNEQMRNMKKGSGEKFKNLKNWKKTKNEAFRKHLLFHRDPKIEFSQKENRPFYNRTPFDDFFSDFDVCSDVWKKKGKEKEDETK